MDRLILITGATGHSGKYAIERFAMRKEECSGMRFRALVRASSNTDGINRSDFPVELVVGDILDDDCLRKALTNVDTLLNIFGIIDNPARVARLAAEAGVRRIISVHTTGIYSRYKYAAAGYIEDDRQVTEICNNAHIALTILRPTMIYGDLDDQNICRFIRMMDKFPRMPLVNGGRYPLQPVHRQDLGYAYADVLLAGAVCEGKNYVLSGKEPILLRDMLSQIAECLGKDAKFFSVPYGLALAGAWGVYLLSFGRVDYREKVQRLVEPRAYSHDAATADFGYAPRSFADGVRDEVAAYQRNKERRA